MVSKSLSLLAFSLMACGTGMPTGSNQVFSPASNGSSSSSSSGGSGHGTSSGSSTGGIHTLLAIHNVTSQVTGTNVVINWQTSIAGDSTVDYGLSDFGTVAHDASAVTAHQYTLASMAQGTYQFRVTSRSPDGQQVSDAGAGAGYRFTIVVGPNISAVDSDFNVGTHVLTVTWSTDIPADSRVDLGTTDYSLLSNVDTKLATSHSLTLTLNDAGSYIFRVVSKDGNGVSVINNNNGKGYPVTVPGIAVQDGTLAHPFIIDASSLPITYNDNQDTDNSGESSIDAYPPATNDEGGAEFIYTFTLKQPANFSGTVTDAVGVDIDIMLCQSLAPVELFGNSTTSRADTTLSNILLPAGTYWLALDTFVNAKTGTPVPQPGPYSLSVSITAP